MVRRIVCSLLIPAILANLAAMCCAHSHHGMPIGEHSARTHIHFFGHSHDHSHSGHSCEHHHHGPGPERDPAEFPNSTADSGLHILPIHDHDAIYFGCQDELRIPPVRIVLLSPSVSVTFPVVCRIPGPVRRIRVMAHSFYRSLVCWSKTGFLP